MFDKLELPADTVFQELVSHSTFNFWFRGYSLDLTFAYATFETNTVCYLGRLIG